jgi:CBS domain-containing protein
MDDIDRSGARPSMRPGKVAESARGGGDIPAVTVRDLIHTSVVTVTPETTMASAAAGMVRARAGSAVVVQASFLAGILTKWDVLRATASGEDPSRSLVSAWMTPDPRSVSPDTSAEDATQIMVQHGFHHLPVVEGKQVRGVIRLRDLLAAGIRRPTAPIAPDDPADVPAAGDAD